MSRSRSEEFRPDACDPPDQTYPRRVAPDCSDRSTLRDYAEGAHRDTKRAPNVISSMRDLLDHHHVDDLLTRSFEPAIERRN